MTPPRPPLGSLLLFLWTQQLVFGQSESSSSSNKICTSPTNTFTAKVDLYASERGYYVFEECGEDWINPTIGLEFGVTYTFIQKDRTNFWHPLDFGYFPDAVHLGADLLDPRVDQRARGAGSVAASDVTAEAASLAAGTDSCARNMTCPAPMHFLNDGYLGTYSNLPDVLPITVNQHDTGLDLYYDFFFQEIHAWTGYGTFSIKLNFDDETYVDNDLFYYCRIHPKMVGRIKLLKNGQPVHEPDLPPMYFAMDTISQFDSMCGTYNLNDYQLPHPECPEKFVCDADERMRDFATCIDSMNCLMIRDMTTKASSSSPLVLFIHQMIPHHQNAVNMAKALLKAAFLPCDDLTDTQDPYCIMTGVLYGIVNKQNYEIGVMINVLAALNAPLTDDCQVLIPNQDESSRAEFFPTKSGMAAGVIFGAMAFL